MEISGLSDQIGWTAEVVNCLVRNIWGSQCLCRSIEECAFRALILLIFQYIPKYILCLGVMVLVDNANGSCVEFWDLSKLLYRYY